RSPSRGLARRGERTVKDLAVRVEREEATRLVRRDPANLVVFVIVRRRVAAGRLHEEEVHELVHALARRCEPVIGRADIAKDADLEAGLLLHLAEGRVLDLLA